MRGRNSGNRGYDLRRRRSTSQSETQWVAPKWFVGAQWVQLQSDRGEFAPMVDQIGVGHGQRGTIALWLLDRDGQRAMVPWWVRTSVACRVQWGLVPPLVTEKPRVARRAHATVISLSSSAGWIAEFANDVSRLPATMAALLGATSTPEEQAVLRDYALEHALEMLNASLSAPPRGPL